MQQVITYSDEETGPVDEGIDSDKVSKDDADILGHFEKNAVLAQVTHIQLILLNWIRSAIKITVDSVLMVKAWIICALYQQAPQETEIDPGQKKTRRS